MKVVVLLCVVLVAVTADHHKGEDQDYDNDRSARRSFPFLGEALKIGGRLSSRVDDLEERADSAKEQIMGYVERGRILNARVTRLEDDGCDRRHFQCGGYERRCISDLLVCDGVNDCKSGSDEDADLCRSRVPIGATFDGDVPQWACGGDAVRMRFTIIGESQEAWFKSRVRVKAAFTIKYADESIRSAVIKGYYNFAMRTLFLGANEEADTRIALTCHFDGVQDDRCLAFIRFASLDYCANFGLRRID